MKPSVGRIVHYVTRVQSVPDGPYEAVCNAAVITEVGDVGSPVNLTVFKPMALSFKTAKEDDTPGRPGGTWHWPEKL